MPRPNFAPFASGEEHTCQIHEAEKVDQPAILDTKRTRRKEAAAAWKKAELGDVPMPPKYGSGDFKKTEHQSVRDIGSISSATGDMASWVGQIAIWGCRPKPPKFPSGTFP